MMSLFKYGTFIILFIIILFFLKKYYKRINNKYRYYKKKVDLKYSLFKRKHYIGIEYLKKIIFIFLFLFLISLLLVLFLYFNNIFVFEKGNIKFKLESIKIEKYAYDFLWSQISSTLIVSSIISLLSIFDTTYIYGKKQINVIFSSKSLFSLGKLFIFLVFFSLISLSVCLTKTHYYLLLFSFITSLMIIFYMIFKVIIFYTHPQLFKNVIKFEYILGERKHIKNAMPRNPHRNLQINDFKEHTMILIQKNDNEYVANISVFFNMLEISLLINKKEIQEYYTETIYRTDFISSILEIIKHLISNNKEIEACNYMAQLYNRIKYYQIVLVQDTFSYGIINSLIIKGKYIFDEEECCRYYDNLWSIIKDSIYFLYLYNCEIDLSYTRLGKLGYLHYYNYSKYLEDVYISITENSLISHKEKSRLFEKLYDNIRMMEHKEEFPDLNVNQLLSGEIINDNKIEIPLVIKGEPIVLMFLKMFEEKDLNNIINFKTMNVSDKLMDYITIVSTLSIIEYINKNGQRKNLNDLDIDINDLTYIFEKSKFYNIRNINNLEKLYEIIFFNYIENKNIQKRPYILLPRLCLSDEVVNSYFYYVFSKNKINKDFCNSKKKEISKRIIRIIKTLNIK